MLVIRQAQIQALIAGDDQELTKLVEHAVRAAEPVRFESMAPGQVTPMIEKCVARAREFGIERAENIAAFTELMLVISPWFDREPEIAKVFADDRFSKDDLIFQLFERVPEAAWDIAVNSYDSAYWLNDGSAPEPVFAESETSPDLAGLTVKQADAVDKAAEAHQKESTEESGKHLAAEVEKLCFYRTALRDRAARRAAFLANKARDIVLSKAIVLKNKSAA
ncbi:MAG: hypothetical protein IPM25_12255 [Chloracidobacterium sp.]|nr:hypothetical protein [Chloracidobacterium sp.]